MGTPHTPMSVFSERTAKQVVSGHEAVADGRLMDKATTPPTLIYNG
jgi:hypothetical protein